MLSRRLPIARPRWRWSQHYIRRLATKSEISHVAPSTAAHLQIPAQPTVQPAEQSGPQFAGSPSTAHLPTPAQDAVPGLPVDQPGLQSADTGTFIGPALPPDNALHTVPVPIVVGPSETLSPGAAQAVEDAALAARDGGFFFGKPMALCEGWLHLVHDTTGLPWWATLAVATLGVRLLVFPLQVMQSRSAARMTKIKPTMDALTSKMKTAYSHKKFDDVEKYRTQLQDLMQRNGVSPLITMASAVGVLPVWITFFFTIRMMVHRDGVGLAHGGFAWFTDLTVADPYLALPVISSSTVLLMVQLGDPGQLGAKLDVTQEMMRNVMRGAALFMIPATMSFENGVFVYWISTNLLSIAQTMLLRDPQIREMVGMPPPPTPDPQSTDAQPNGGLLQGGFRGLLPGVLQPEAAPAPAAVRVPTVTYTRNPKDSKKGKRK